MTIYIYRQLKDGTLLYIEGGKWDMAFAMRQCQTMFNFYAHHKIPVTHWIATQRGWTVEYVQVSEPEGLP